MGSGKRSCSVDSLPNLRNDSPKGRNGQHVQGASANWTEARKRQIVMTRIRNWRYWVARLLGLRRQRLEQIRAYRKADDMAVVIRFRTGTVDK